MAAKIQQRNEVVNRQCAELQAKLSTEGFRSCVLKGQGVAMRYPEHLRGLRQSGDIDVWIEVKGIENDCYYLKKKLFRKYLEDLYNTTGKKSIFFEVYSKKQLLQAIEIIKQYE